MKRLPLMLVLGFLASFAAAANLPVKRYALFVGANLGGPTQQPLLYAQKDALKMQQVMQEVGGVSASDRILLLDPTPDEVRAALTALAARMTPDLGNESRRSEFLFYYSGHSDEEGLILGAQELSYKALRDGLQTIPADVRIAILDSCSSGAFARIKGGVPRASFLGQDSSQMKGHAFLTSSSETEASQESDTLEGSFFTHYLVSGLRGGADRLGDGLITLNEAYEYAFQNTLARTESTRAGPQHPSYEIQLSGTGNLILSDVKTATARLILAAEVVGKVYVRGAGGQLYAEITKESGNPVSLAFPVGTYTVTAVNPQKSLSARVTLQTQNPMILGNSDFQEQNLARFAVRGPAPELEPEEPEFDVDLTSFSLGLVPGWESGTSEPRTLSVSPLVDFSSAIRGIQAAGLIGLNAQTLDGVQFAGLGVLNEGAMRGIQGGGLFSITGEKSAGVQVGGVFTIAGGNATNLIQTAGVFNLSHGRFRGLQIAGVVNIADEFEGIQASGVVNVAGEVKGLQVGFININSHIEGAGIGLLFISPDAYYHPIVAMDNRGEVHALFQWGMGWLYWLGGIIGETNNVSSSAPWEQLGGVGFKFNNRLLFADLDAGWSGLHQDQSIESRPYFRATVGTQSGWISFQAGLLVTPDSDGESYTLGPLDLRLETRWFAGLRLF